jgi:hypothetical protein
MALDGRLCLSIKPIGYFENLDRWRQHPENVKLNEIARSVEAMAKDSRPYFNFDDYDQDTDDEEEDDDLVVSPGGARETNEEKESDHNDDQDSDDDADRISSSKQKAKVNPFDLLGDDDGNN